MVSFGISHGRRSTIGYRIGRPSTGGHFSSCAQNAKVSGGGPADTALFRQDVRPPCRQGRARRPLRLAPRAPWRPTSKDGPVSSCAALLAICVAPAQFSSATPNPLLCTKVFLVVAKDRWRPYRDAVTWRSTRHFSQMNAFGRTVLVPAALRKFLGQSLAHEPLVNTRRRRPHG